MTTPQPVPGSSTGRCHIIVHHSGSDRDRPLVDEVLLHLRSLERLAGVDVWTDERVRGGDKVPDVILAAIDEADLAVLLVSPDFLTAALLQEAVLPRLLDRQRARTLRVVPVLLRACLLDLHPWLSGLNPLPRGGKEIASLDERARDSVLDELTREVFALCSDESARGAMREPIGAGPPESLTVTPLAGSIEVRLYNESACNDWTLSVLPSVTLRQLTGEFLARIRLLPWRSPEVPRPDTTFSVSYYLEGNHSTPLSKVMTIGEIAGQSPGARQVTLHVTWSKEYLGKR